MECHRLYLIADFENFSPETLKMADVLRYGLREVRVTINYIIIKRM